MRETVDEGGLFAGEEVLQLVRVGLGGEDEWLGRDLAEGAVEAAIAQGGAQGGVGCGGFMQKRPNCFGGYDCTPP